jgi:hypothetical protein
VAVLPDDDVTVYPVIADPLSEFAVNGTEITLPLSVAVPIVGAAGAATGLGVLELLALDAFDGPTEFVAVIAKVYAWLVVKVPVTKIDPSRSVFVYDKDVDGEDVISIADIGAPLLDPRVYAIVTDVVLATVTESIVGALGFPAPPNP